MAAMDTAMATRSRAAVAVARTIKQEQESGNGGIGNVLSGAQRSDECAGSCECEDSDLEIADHGFRKRRRSSLPGSDSEVYPGFKGKWARGARGRPLALSAVLTPSLALRFECGRPAPLDR